MSLRVMQAVAIFCSLCLLPATCFGRAPVVDLSSCAPIGGDYRIGPYLEAAAKYQAIGHKNAIGQLRLLAKTRKSEDQVVIFCRMLFTAREGVPFRRPRIGQPDCVGGTELVNWPLEPIALHKGVPILITDGYRLAGQAEASATYLDWCVKNCDWNVVRFEARESADLKRIVADFIKTRKWRPKMPGRDREFLLRQADEMIPNDA